MDLNYIMDLNYKHICKYILMLVIVTSSTYVIPTCGVLQTHALYVGLIASTVFALLDICFPRYYEKPETWKDTDV